MNDVNGESGKLRSTTILCVRHGGRTVMVGDGQVTLNQVCMKSKAQKVRRLYKKNVLVGFAGSGADAIALFSRFEKKIEEFHGNLNRACVELAKEWRTDRVLRRLEAMMIVADKDNTFLLSGAGDLIEPDDGLIAIGSGGSYALAAARGLSRHSGLGAREIAEEAMAIAAEICIFTNNELIVEEIPPAKD